MTRKLLTLTSCSSLLASGLSAPELKVLDLSRLGHESYLRVQATVPEITLIEGRTLQSGGPTGYADGVIGPFDLKLLASAPKLKWIQSESAGVENVMALPGFAQSRHIAGRSDEENARYEALYLENLKRF